MQFIVPQFINIEPKIIGPITPRQFIILVVTAVILFVNYKILDFTLFVVSGIFILPLALLFAFVKVNGKPFHYFLLNMAETFKRPNLRIWQREHFNIVSLKIKDSNEKKEDKTPQRPQLTTSRLSKLSLVVDTGGAYEEQDQK
ncbi:MAG: PrgI family protein [Parcubacteria group bacterium]|nr:PrgI family protein [Parcubacteria group bacterium]